MKRGQRAREFRVVETEVIETGEEGSKRGDGLREPE